MNDEELIAALLSDPTIGFHEAVKQADADKYARSEREARAVSGTTVPQRPVRSARRLARGSALAPSQA